MATAYLITQTHYDSGYYGGSVEHPHMIAFDKPLADKYVKDHTSYKKAACGCCYTGYSYSVEEIDVLEED